MLGFFLGLLAGVGTPVQTSINASLRNKIKSPYWASTISFSTGMVILFIMVPIIEGNLAISFSKMSQEPAWIWFGGICGVFIVLSNVVCLPKLGSALNTMLLSFGQIMTGLIIDNFGLFNAKVIPMSWSRVIGAILLIVGVILVAKGPDQEITEARHYSIPIVLFIMFGGACCAMQVAINGHLSIVINSSWKSTLYSMTSGTLGCLLMVLIIYLIKGRKGVFSDQDSTKIPFKWYMLGGGVFAVIIVGSNAISGPMLGTGMVTVLNLIAMMITGLVIDFTGFLGIDKQPITRNKVVGIILMLIGTIVITLL